MTAPLHVEIRGPAGTRELTLDAREPIWIGRDDAAHVPLMAQNVSRRHVSLRRTEDGIEVADASANGTIVDGLPLRRAARLFPAAPLTLRVGLFELTVRPKALDPEPPSRPSDGGGPTAGAPVELRRRLHRELLEQMDLAKLSRADMSANELRPAVLAALRRLVAARGSEIGGAEARETLVRELVDEVLGLGPLERLLGDPDVSEIMVVDPHTIFAERRGKVTLTGLRFTDDDSVRSAIERIVTPLGRRIDESTPLVDARLKDGSRVNAVIPPLALRGPCITIRKFAKDPLRMEDLVRFGSIRADMATFLERAVRVRKNVVISGGTGSGKTTLLNVLSAAIPVHERVVTVEDAAELRIPQPHVVSLESRPANLEGKGEYSIRDLVKNALRMRPDRIVVGECRGPEAIDMLQAMNTGHEGSLTTTHANSPAEAVARIETLCLMAGLDLPVHAIRRQIAASVHLVVQQSRLSDGSRRVTSVAEVVGIGDDGEVGLREIYAFKIRRTLADGRVEGDFVATGYLPSFLDQFIAHGLVPDGAPL